MGIRSGGGGATAAGAAAAAGPSKALFHPERANQQPGTAKAIIEARGGGTVRDSAGARC